MARSDGGGARRTSRRAGTRRGTAPRPPHAGPRRARPDARRIAYDVLRAVAERDAYANLALPARLRELGVTGADAGLATELTYGTLRARGGYDAIIAACADRPTDRIDGPVLDVLRLGAHQLLATRVPPHAAVSATVDLARSVTGAGPAKFVNALLRRIATRDRDAWLDLVAPPADRDPVGALAVRHSHPRWIVSALRDVLPAAELAGALAADNAPPEVTLLAKPGRTDVAELVTAGATAGRWSPYAARWPSGDPANLPQIRDGRAAVQDEGSQLVALALAAAPLDGPDARWLDMCAGPGGKTALLTGLAARRDGRLLAADVRAHRAGLVARAIGSGAGERAGVVVADGRAGPWRPGTFDRILVDAPCTGLGALRRRPEARWRRRPADVPELAAVQRELLAAALDAVRPGGVVGYVTCSPHLAETVVVVGDVLSARGDVTVLDAPRVLRDALDTPPDVGPGPYLRLWPHRHDTDAMFCALLRRDGGTPGENRIGA